jgi:hypothetical protein
MKTMPGGAPGRHRNALRPDSDFDAPQGVEQRAMENKEGVFPPATHPWRS